jgi:hypothetical protein
MAAVVPERHVIPGAAAWFARRPHGRVWIAAGWRTETNDGLVEAVRLRGVEAWVVEPRAVDAFARRGDIVLGRLDVRRTLDGVEDGLDHLERLEGRSIRVLNRPAALLRCHDKLQTALRLGRLGLPHPATVHLDHGAPLPRLEFPVVVKPRFGSWGSDVFRCTGAVALAHCVHQLRKRPWFRRHGVLLQEVVPPTGVDLRIVVAAAGSSVRSNGSPLRVSGARMSRSADLAARWTRRRMRGGWRSRRRLRSKPTSSASISCRCRTGATSSSR